MSCPEHRSPEAFVEYRALRERRPVVGMTTFPNTVLLRGPQDDRGRPGAAAAERPRAPRPGGRGLSAADVDLVVLTHAHLDHAGGCASLMAPVVVHELETQSPYWVMAGRPARAAAAGAARPATAGELAPGVEWALTPGHCDGHISLAVETRTAGAPCCAATPSAPAAPDSTPWRRRTAGRVRRCSSPGGASAPGSRTSSSPATCRRSRPEAGRAAQRAATGLCYTQALVTTFGRLLRAYLRVPV